MKTAPRDGNAECRVINLDLNAKTLETVVKYLHYRIINSRLSVSNRAVFDIEPDDALDILNAGIYLQCWLLQLVEVIVTLQKLNTLTKKLTNIFRLSQAKILSL